VQSNFENGHETRVGGEKAGAKRTGVRATKESEGEFIRKRFYRRKTRWAGGGRLRRGLVGVLTWARGRSRATGRKEKGSMNKKPEVLMREEHQGPASIAGRLGEEKGKSKGGGRRKTSCV